MNSTLADFRGKLVQSLVHGSIFSKFGAYSKPGAIHLISFEDAFTILHSEPKMKFSEIELQKTSSILNVKFLSSGWIYLDIEASEASLRYFETLGMASKMGSQRIYILIKLLT